MPDMSDTPFVPDDGATNQVAIDYIKGPDFRVVWADGVIGSPTPAGNIHFAIYAERPAIPRRQVHTIDPSTLEASDPIPEKTIGRNSIVREMAFDVHLGPDVALLLARWLVEQVNVLKAKRGEGKH